jgi:hypothetical protein
MANFMATAVCLCECDVSNKFKRASPYPDTEYSAALM